DVDQNMEEADIVRHILKGISESVYLFLQLKEVSTVQEVLETCQKLDETFSHRISHVSREFPRLQTVLQTPVYPEPVSTVSAPVASAPSVLVDEIVQRVLEQMQNASPSLGNVAAVRPQRVSDTRQCYYCHRLGHVERFCRKRAADRRRQSYASSVFNTYPARQQEFQQSVHRSSRDQPFSFQNEQFNGRRNMYSFDARPTSP